MSVFTDLPESYWVHSNELAFAIRDKYPVSPGHTLVVPKREVAQWWDATRDEQVAILELLDLAKSALDANEPKPDGYNIGINCGVASGQTVMHLHVHLIPRYAGDIADARGGVRWIFPERANYWDKPT